jgi:hypothetical protein
MTGTVVFVLVAAVLIAIACKLMWDSRRAHKRRDERGEPGPRPGDHTPRSPE